MTPFCHSLKENRCRAVWSPRYLKRVISCLWHSAARSMMIHLPTLIAVWLTVLISKVIMINTTEDEWDTNTWRLSDPKGKNCFNEAPEKVRIRFDVIFSKTYSNTQLSNSLLFTLKLFSTITVKTFLELHSPAGGDIIVALHLNVEFPHWIRFCGLMSH